MSSFSDAAGRLPADQFSKLSAACPATADQEGAAAVGRPLRGLAMMLAAAVAGVAVGISVKAGSETLPTPMVIFLRYLLALIVLAPLWWMKREEIASSRHLSIHLLRGLITTLAVGLYFYTVAVMPLSAAIAIQFIAPLFVPPLARLALGERTGLLAYLGVVLAVGGAIVSANPSAGEFQAVALLAGLASALLGASMTVHAKTLMNVGESLVTMAFWFTLIGAVGSGAFVLVMDAWVMPGWQEMTLLALGGALATYSKVFIYGAMRDLPMGLFASLKLLPIPLGAVAAFLIFAEIPNGMTLLGSGLIIAGVVTAQAASFGLRRSDVPTARRG